MPDLQNRLYCSEQIHIPPSFPYIMKLYCKAAIRTQPYDLLKWSAAYFRALANGVEPPVKERVEYPPFDSPTGLTPGYIRILIRQLGKDPETVVTAQTLFQKWSDICLDEFLLVKLIALLGAYTTVNWVKFVGVSAGFISKTLTQTMILICELFTEEPEGGMASIPYELFVDLYEFLAKMECGPLTDKEKLELEGVIFEEDICDVAERIKQGQYLGEVEGESVFGVEVAIRGEEPGEIGEHGRSVSEVPKEPEDVSFGSEKSKEDELDIEEGEGKEGEFEASLEAEEEEIIGEQSTPGESVDVSEVGEAGGTISETLPDDMTADLMDVELVQVDVKSPSVEISPFPQSSQVGQSSVTEESKEVKKMNLEELEESIRERIEEKLAAEAESLDEEEREFVDIGTYVMEAAQRVRKLTAETIGFKIFRKYMRQEVPGIGPAIDSEQVENVIDFMDFWANKQQKMVMPRNIRHWMCPPLEKPPLPEP